MQAAPARKAGPAETAVPANPALDGDVYRLLPQTYVADVILDYLGIKLAAKGCAEDDLLCIYRRAGPLSLDVLQFNIWQECTVVKGGYDSSTWEPLDVWPTDHKALLSRFELILDWDNLPGKSDNR